MDNDKMVKVFLKIRDKRTELKREFEAADAELKAKQERIENALLDFLNTNKMESAKTSLGTFYRQEELTPTGSDWDAFYKWVKEHDAFEALEKRIKKTFVKEYMEAHEGDVPPGVSVYREFVVRVRRGNK